MRRRYKIIKVCFDNEVILQGIAWHTKLKKTIAAFKKLIVDFNSCETHVLILILEIWEMTHQHKKQLGGSENTLT